MATKRLKCGCKAPLMGPHVHCPKCDAPPVDLKTGAPNQELRNYDPMWGDGDVFCKLCGARVRSWDRD